jgi:hypothetical protein
MRGDHALVLMMGLRGSVLEQDDPRDMEALAGIHAALSANPSPDLGTLAALLERLQPLTRRADDRVARRAGQLELQILGAMLAHQATSLRALARQLQQLAHWLPPERPGQN